MTIEQGNFGDPSVADRVGAVDAVMLYDVLEHQVRPDWDEVMALWGQRARCLLVFHQGWIAGNSAIRLLDLGREEYLRNVPMPEFHSEAWEKLDEMHPDHDRQWRDVHHIWQWGIPPAAVEAHAERLGFAVAHREDLGRFPGLPNFEQNAWVFVRP